MKMGYTTEFFGTFEVTPKLSKDDSAFLKSFNQTRRMKRNLCELKYGIEGEWFVEGKGQLGQENDKSVMDHTAPPRTQPGLWCQWIPNDDDTGIKWDDGEKFYHAEKWIAYLIDGFLAPKGYVVNGKVRAQGEDRGGQWTLSVRDNKVYRGSFLVNQELLENKPKPITELKQRKECNTCLTKLKCALTA